MQTNEPKELLVYSVPEAGRLLSLSRATAYALASQRLLPAISFGKRLIVPQNALEEYERRCRGPPQFTYNFLLTQKLC